jgi:hypothetical protein
MKKISWVIVLLLCASGLYANKFPSPNGLWLSPGLGFQIPLEQDQDKKPFGLECSVFQMSWPFFWGGIINLEQNIQDNQLEVLLGPQLGMNLIFFSFGIDGGITLKELTTGYKLRFFVGAGLPLSDSIMAGLLFYYALEWEGGKNYDSLGLMLKLPIPLFNP